MPLTVPAGTYTLTSGEVLVTKNLTITGAGADATIVRAAAPQRIFHTQGAGKTIAINALTIRDGLVQFSGGVTNGGGILNEDAALSLSGDVLTNDVADASGTSANAGGIASGGAIDNSGTLTLTDCSLSADAARARGASGHSGGIASGGAIHSVSSSTLTLTRTSIANNIVDARGGAGGANSQPGGIAQGAGVFASTTGATVVARALKPGPVTNTASAASTTFDPNASDNSAGAALTITALVVSGARISPTTFRIGTLLAKLSRKTPTGTTIRFSLPAPAGVKLAFARATSRAQGRQALRQAVARQRPQAALHPLRGHGDAVRRRPRRPQPAALPGPPEQAQDAEARSLPRHDHGGRQLRQPLCACHAALHAACSGQALSRGWRAPAENAGV